MSRYIPDGLEERTAHYEEDYAGEVEKYDIDVRLADEARSGGPIPVACLVRGHDTNEHGVCRRCGDNVEL